MITPRFNIGDLVWFACYSLVDVKKPCPVCFGKLTVTLILGNGESAVLACDYCGKGYDGPRGFVIERETKAVAYEREIDSVTVSTSGAEYGCSHSTLPEVNVFATEAEAMARAIEVAAVEQEARERSVGYLKHDAKKSFAWNAGYHMREAKRLRAEADRHEAKVALCKAAAP